MIGFKSNFRTIGVFDAIHEACEGFPFNTMNLKKTAYTKLVLISSGGFDHFGIKSYFHVSYNPSREHITIRERFEHVIPAEREKVLLEMLNYLNPQFLNFAVYLFPKDKVVEVRSEIILKNHAFNKNEFQQAAKGVVFIAGYLFPILNDFFDGNRSEKEVWEIIKGWDIGNSEDDAERLIFWWAEKSCPLILHDGGNSITEPAHSHDLTDLGMPEFVVDHHTVSVEINSNLIHQAYKYFIRLENHGKLESILEGHTLRVSRNELLLEDIPGRPNYYFFREVPATCTTVRDAYSDTGIEPGMRFVQIYTEENEDGSND